MPREGQTTTTQGRPYESIAGGWKLACALAVLFGHHLVTVNEAVPADPVWKAIFASLQVFAPFQFFFFSGFLAASALRSPERPLGAMMASRALRIYVLVLAAVALGVAGRLLAPFLVGTWTTTTVTIWPLDTWAGPFPWDQVVRHLNPFGFADHTRLNYAIWYLYHELRLVLLLPLFRWILLRPRFRDRGFLGACLLAIAAAGEFLLWDRFPDFRTSPFQTLAFGVFFLGGAECWIALRGEGFLLRLPRSAGVGLLATGAALILLQPFEIQLPIGNPPIRLLPMLLGQAAFFCGLSMVFGNPPASAWWKRACEWSVGIYVVHPPLHMFTTWWSYHSGSLLPLLISIVLSIPLGILFHHAIERPSQRWVARLSSSLSTSGSGRRSAQG